MYWKNVIVSVLIAAVTSATVVALLPRGNKASTVETLYQRVMRTGTLRCGYFVMDSLMSRDPATGKLSGPGYDITEALAKNLSLKVEWTTEIGFAGLGEDLKNGRYDMLCTPLVPNAPRGRVMETSRTLFFQPVTIWLHKDDPRLNEVNQAWLDNPTTSFISVDGTAFETIISNYFPHAKITSLPELTPLSDMFLELSGRKVDVMLMTHYNAVTYADKNNGVIRQYGSRIVNTPPYAFAWKKGEPDFASMMNMAIEELIYNGVIDNIMNKYDPDGVFYKRVTLAQ